MIHVVVVCYVWVLFAVRCLSHEGSLAKALQTTPPPPRASSFSSSSFSALARPTDAFRIVKTV